MPSNTRLLQRAIARLTPFVFLLLLLGGCVGAFWLMEQPARTKSRAREAGRLQRLVERSNAVHRLAAEHNARVSGATWNDDFNTTADLQDHISAGDARPVLLSVECLDIVKTGRGQVLLCEIYASRQPVRLELALPDSVVTGLRALEMPASAYVVTRISDFNVTSINSDGVTIVGHGECLGFAPEL
jgi:hypothetical protein